MLYIEICRVTSESFGSSLGLFLNDIRCSRFTSSSSSVRYLIPSYDVIDREDVIGGVGVTWPPFNVERFAMNGLDTRLLELPT